MPRCSYQVKIIANPFMTVMYITFYHCLNDVVFQITAQWLMNFIISLHVPFCSIIQRENILIDPTNLLFFQDRMNHASPRLSGILLDTEQISGPPKWLTMSPRYEEKGPKTMLKYLFSHPFWPIIILVEKMKYLTCVCGFYLWHCDVDRHFKF